MNVWCEVRGFARRHGFPLLCLQVLVGCAGAPLEGSRSGDVALEPKRDFRACIESAAGKPEYEPLTGKLYVGDNRIYPDSYLKNPNRPDKAETELLRALHAELHQCRSAELATAATGGPSDKTAAVDSHRAEDKLWAEAIAGRLTWGKFNAGRKDIAVRLQARLARERTQEVSDPWRQDTFASSQNDTRLPHYGKLDGDDVATSRSRVQVGVGIGNPPRGVYCDQLRNSRECQLAR